MIKSIVYSREFLSSTVSIDKSYHGSPDYHPYQDINNLDKKIRKEMEKRFSLKEVEEIYSGFDGKRQYQFEIIQRLYPHKGDKHTKYFTEIHIKKAGSKSHVMELCDLEEFLIENKFTVKNK